MLFQLFYWNDTRHITSNRAMTIVSLLYKNDQKKRAMLYTNLNHIESTNQLNDVIGKNKNVVMCYGRMNHDCIAVFNALEQLGNEHSDVQIYDIEYDNPEFEDFKQSTHTLAMTELPYLILFQNGEVREVYTGKKDENQLRNIIHSVYKPLITVV